MTYTTSEKTKWKMAYGWVSVLWVWVICLSLGYPCTWWTTPGLSWPSGKVSEICTRWWAECTSAGRTAQGGPGGCCQHLRDRKKKWLWNKVISTNFSVGLHEHEGLCKAVISSFSLPGRCWTTGMSSFFRSSALPTPDSISNWGELMAPPLSITSLSANTWGPEQQSSMDNLANMRHPTAVLDILSSSALFLFPTRNIVSSYPFCLTLLRVLHSDGTLSVKEDLRGHAAHLRLQVGTRQRRPQVGAGGAPPLPCAAK